MTQVDSRKERYDAQAALELVQSADHLWVARGKSVRYIDLQRDPPDDEELAKIITGPTGNLRAPTLRRGKKMFVGFHAEELANQMLE